MSIINLLLYAFFAVGGSTCFKLGSMEGLSLQLTGKAFSIHMSWLSLLGLCMYVISFLLYLSMLARQQINTVVPLSVGIVYLLTMVVSILVFHEVITLWKAVGAALVMCGVLIMTAGK